MAFVEYHNYSQNLLFAQYEVSEIIKHLLTRGEVREEFIIDYLVRSIGNVSDQIQRGFIELNGAQLSAQTDILLIHPYAEKAAIGNQNIIVSAEECYMAMEVKSTLNGNHLNHLNNQSARLKAVNPKIMTGMFAYKCELEKKTILNRFGYDYDKETDTFYMSPDDPSPIWYPYIDFILILDKLEPSDREDSNELFGAKQIFLQKDLEKDIYYQGTYEPAVRNLVGMVKSLLVG